MNLYLMLVPDYFKRSLRNQKIKIEENCGLPEHRFPFDGRPELGKQLTEELQEVFDKGEIMALNARFISLRFTPFHTFSAHSARFKLPSLRPTAAHT